MIRELRLELPGGAFQALEIGDPAAPPVLCLHGFPDLPRSFVPVMERLAAAGWRPVAPWMRGYAPSVVAGPYHAERIGDDVLELAAALSPDRPLRIVGHDWGAVATYVALSKAPERFVRAATMAVPHPAAFLANLKQFPAQLGRSWYMAFFQLPFVAELALAADDYRMVEELWRAWSPGFSPPAELVAELKACLRRSMPAPISYYRAIFWPPAEAARRARERHPIATPTLHLHGAADGCVAAELASGQEKFFTAELVSEVVPGVGHFLHLERPDVVGARLVDWMGAP